MNLLSSISNNISNAFRFAQEIQTDAFEFVQEIQTEGYFETRPEEKKPLASQESLKTDLMCQDLATIIGSFLPVTELVQAAEGLGPESFNPQWEKYDLKQLFPRLSIIDEAMWKRCIDTSGLSFEDSLDVKIGLLENSLKDPSFTQEKKVRLESLLEECKEEKSAQRKELILGLTQMFEKVTVEGSDKDITLLTVPKGLSYPALMTKLQNPINGQAVPFADVWPKIAADLRSDTTEKTYMVAITNSFLSGSRNLSYYRQKELAERQGCRLPKVTEYFMLAGITYINSSQRPVPSGMTGLVLECLFPDSPMCTFGQTRRHFLLVWGVAVGSQPVSNFYGGLRVSDFYGGVFGGVGAAGCWKF